MKQLALRQAVDADAAAINPLCRFQVMTHGRQVEHVAVLLHGLTNCPQQFCRLGEQFFEMGYNVLIPRYPHHGLSNRLTPALAQLTAEELLAMVEEVVNLAHGLGRHVTVVGFSLGGVLAGWVAQYRADVAQVMIVSPAFWLRQFPVCFRKPIINTLLAAPNFFRWWNPLQKDKIMGPAYGYPRFASRALAHMLRLGWLIQAESACRPPAAASVVLVTNPTDMAVDSRVAAQIAQNWQQNGADAVQHYQFEARHRLPHDLIDPNQPNQQVDLVYPVLVELIAGANSKQQIANSE
jgi:carboxylesterase